MLCKPWTDCCYCSVPLIVFISVAAVDLSAGVVGLTLTYSIMLTSVFQPFIEGSAELENLVSLLLRRI